MIRSIFLAAASVMATASAPPSNEAIVQAQPVADAFYAAVVAYGRKLPFKPAVELATVPGAIRYDPQKRAVVIVPYDVVDPGTRAAMERFAAIGTLGLSGQQQYVEIFNNLLVAHELGHWIQEISRRPLTRWQAEYDANRMMVAFWGDHPVGASTERRLGNFVAQRTPTPDLVPTDQGRRGGVLQCQYRQLGGRSRAIQPLPEEDGQACNVGKAYAVVLSDHNDRLAARLIEPPSQNAARAVFWEGGSIPASASFLGRTAFATRLPEICRTANLHRHPPLRPPPSEPTPALIVMHP